MGAWRHVIKDNLLGAIGKKGAPVGHPFYGNQWCGAGGCGGEMGNIVGKMPSGSGVPVKVLSDDEYEARLNQNLFPGDKVTSNAEAITPERAAQLAEIHEANPDIYPNGAPEAGIYIRESALVGERSDFFLFDGTISNRDYIPAHETAHILDMQRGWSSSLRYREAVRKDGNTVRRNPGEYMTYDVALAEDFAEGLVGYLAFPAQFRATFPGRSAYYDSILE